MENKKYIYGIHSVKAAVANHSQAVQCLFVQTNRRDARMKELLTLAKKHSVTVKEMSRSALNNLLSDKVKHQGVIAQCSQRLTLTATNLDEFLDQLGERPFLLILDGVQDPHNLGACLRSANATGVHAVIAPKDNAVGLTPSVRKVASGAAETIPFFQVTNISRAMKALKKRGVWLFGATEYAEMSLYESDLTGAIALVLGAEGQGLRRLTAENCDYLLKLPMKGTVPSLNVSVACGVMLYEALRQRQSLMV